MATKIMLDAGHGGTDPGAVYEDRREKEDVLALTLALGEVLSEMGYDVEYTRTTDVYDSPVQKARIGNASNADYFISLHRNSSPEANQYNGVQTLVYNDAGTKARLGRNINKELEGIGFRNINVAERPNLAVLKRTKMPAVLLEVGFINSDKDNDLFDSKFDDIVEAIARGIDNTLSQTVFSENDLYSPKTEKLTDDMETMSAINSEFDVPGESEINKKTNKYQLLIGIYRSFPSASYQMNNLINEGFEADVYEDDGLYQVRLGKFDDAEDAVKEQKRLRNKGYNTLIVKSF